MLNLGSHQAISSVKSDLEMLTRIINSPLFIIYSGKEHAWQTEVVAVAMNASQALGMKSQLLFFLGFFWSVL